MKQKLKSILTSTTTTNTNNFVTTFFFYLLLLGLLEWLVRSEIIPAGLLPSPSQVYLVIIKQQELIISSFSRTAALSLISFLLASSVAFVLAVFTHYWPSFKSKISPFTLFLQTVPVIALAPLLVIYFGYGIPTIVAASLIVCFFPVFASTLVGLGRAQKSHLELFKFLRAKKWQRLVYLEIPSSIPYLLTGLKTAAGLSVVGVVSGEFVAGGGLGALIDSARLQQRLDLIYASLIGLAIIGLTMMSLAEMAFRRIFRKYLTK